MSIPPYGAGRRDLTRLDEQRAAAPETTARWCGVHRPHPEHVWTSLDDEPFRCSPETISGQAAYEAFYDATPAGRGLEWHEIGDVLRGFWEAAAQAAIAAWQHLNAIAVLAEPDALDDLAAAQERPAPDLAAQLAEERALRLRLAGERDEARSDYSRLRAALLEGGQSDTAVRKRCLAIIATAGTQPQPELGTAWRLLDEARALLAVTEAERNDLRQALDERNAQLDAFTHHVIDVTDSHALARVAAALREKARMTSIDQFSKSTQPEEQP